MTGSSDPAKVPHTRAVYLQFDYTSIVERYIRLARHIYACIRRRIPFLEPLSEYPPLGSSPGSRVPGKEGPSKRSRCRGGPKVMRGEWKRGIGEKERGGRRGWKSSFSRMQSEAGGDDTRF